MNKGAPCLANLLFLRSRTQLIIFSLTVFLTGSAQDPVFANSNQSLVYLNPSFTGSNGYIRDQVSFRNQWPAISSNYITAANCFDVYVKPMRAGIGIITSYDDQARGTIVWKSIGLTYAQYFYSKSKKLKIVPSLQASYIMGSLDKSKLSFGYQVDPRRGFYWNSSEIVPSSNKNNVDISAGLMMNYKKFYVGFAAFHINQPDIGFLGVSKLPCRFSVHASYNFFVKEKNIIQVFARYDQQMNFKYVALKVNALLAKHLMVGTAISSADQINMNLGYRHNLFAISLGYDRWYNTSYLRGLDAWEVHASLNIRHKENRRELGNFEEW